LADESKIGFPAGGKGGGKLVERPQEWAESLPNTSPFLRGLGEKEIRVVEAILEKPPEGTWEQ